MADRQPDSRTGGRLHTVRVEERGGAAVVAVRGYIDAGSASLLRDALAWAVTCHERVVVDLSSAETIDRAGLSVIIAAQERAQSRAVQLCFTAPSPRLLIALCQMRSAGMPETAETPSALADAEVDSGAGFTLPQPRSPLAFDGALA
jgi:anti-sigma B factor antagonist